MSTINAILKIQAYNKAANKHKINIKIGTVLTSFNSSEIYEIYCLLSTLNIDFWKIYKLRKRGKTANKDTYNKLRVSREIEKDIEKLMSINVQPFHIYYSQSSSSDLYIIIEPDGEIIMVVGEAKISYGNIFYNGEYIDVGKLYTIMNTYNFLKTNQNIHFTSWNE